MPASVGAANEATPLLPEPGARTASAVVPLTSKCTVRPAGDSDVARFVTTTVKVAGRPKRAGFRLLVTVVAVGTRLTVWVKARRLPRKVSPWPRYVAVKPLFPTPAAAGKSAALNVSRPAASNIPANVAADPWREMTTRPCGTPVAWIAATVTVKVTGWPANELGRSLPMVVEVGTRSTAWTVVPVLGKNCSARPR